MQACMQAGQRASKMSEEAFEEAERREEELKQAGFSCMQGKCMCRMLLTGRKHDAC